MGSGFKSRGVYGRCTKGRSDADRPFSVPGQASLDHERGIVDASRDGAATVSPSRRNPGIDAVRVVAMLAVVAGHLWGAGLPRPLIYSWHVPVFFFISGVLWTPGRTMVSELRSRALTLLVPYAAWVLIVLVAVVPVLVARGEIPPPDLGALLLGGRGPTTPFWTIWFVTALFLAAVWMRLLERVPLPVRWGVAIVATLLVVVVAPAVLSRLPFSLGHSAVGLLYLLAGAGFARLRARSALPWPWALVAVAVALLVAFLPGSGFDLKPLRLGLPVLGLIVSIVISAGLVVLGERALRRAPAWIATAVSRLAAASLVVLFVHVPLGFLLGVAGPNRTPLGFLLVAVLSWVLGLVLIAIPSTWPLTGSGAPVRSRGRAAAPPGPAAPR